MYEIAFSAVACLRSQTRADVAWQVSTDLPHEGGPRGGLLLTAGGGRIGTLMGGIFDGQLSDIASRQLPFAALHLVTVGSVEALMTGLPVGGSARVMVAPADLIPVNAWQAFLDKVPVAIHARISDGTVTDIQAYGQGDVDTAPEHVAAAFRQGVSGSVISDDEVISVFVPRTACLIAGNGPIAEAIADIAARLGWDAAIEPSPSNVAGLAATLSEMDCIIVMGHDVETSSRCLEAALSSRAGYIGALGSKKMQESRAEWLAFREVTDLSRVHGPAGFDIGAATPYEIAISIIAEAIAVRSRSS